MSEMTEIECRVCKKKFKKKSGNQVYCSEECRNKGKGEIMRQSRKKWKNRKKKMNLTEIEREAKEAGMSYGRYVAMIEMKRKSC